MHGHQYPTWLSQTAIYQIFPPSFQDSNGDGIGDLRGILARLDYIKELGFGTVWLSPIFESPFADAGYDVTDYYKIAPRYGTMADFEALVEGLHARGMRLFLDFVPGHTSNQHPWFDASARSAQGPLADRYIWTDTTFYIGADAQFVVGHGDRDGNYMANFFYFQPALNYGYADPDPKRPWQLPTDHPSVKALKEEIFRVMRFWLDKGVDGYRVDMAASLIKGNDPKTIQPKMIEFWKEVRQWWDRDYPEAALISEWSNPSEAVETGFHMDFMIHFNGASYMKLFRGENRYTIFDKNDVSYFAPAGAGELQTFLRELQGHLAYIGDRGWISAPTGNHDLPRYALERSEAELKCILCFLFTLPAIPTLYYGDEIGLRAGQSLSSKEGAYRRTDARTPMQWDDSPNSGFSKASPDQLYLPQDPSEQRPLVSEQLAREDSLLNLVKKLLKLRQSVPCLGASGSLTQLNSPDQSYPAVFLREYDGQRALIAINPLASETCAGFSLKGKLAAPVLGEATVEAKAETKTAIHDKNIRITLAAFGFYVAEVER